MNIYGVAAISSGADMARGLLEAGFPLKGMITLEPADHGDKVSGFRDLTQACAELGLDQVRVQSYGLTAVADRERLLSTEIDLLVIMGWQRLLPQWLIDHSRFGGIGLHGSAEGITGGRGRSPQNWALMLGKESFHLSIFFLDSGVDSGAVIDSRAIPITQWDDIRTSYYKVGRAAVEMIAQGWASGRIQRREAQPQQGSPKYLPKREPPDGAVDWGRGATDIFNFVRALTRPYPGAFTGCDGGTMKLWRVRPFITAEDFSSRVPGEIVQIFEHGELLVKAGEGMILVDEFDWLPGPGGASLKPGDVLASVDFTDQLRTIAERHIARYPDAPLADDILRLARLS
jgi:methionyl-tRNA formyltransferase